MLLGRWLLQNSLLLDRLRSHLVDAKLQLPPASLSNRCCDQMLSAGPPRSKTQSAGPLNEGEQSAERWPLEEGEQNTESWSLQVGEQSAERWPFKEGEHSAERWSLNEGDQSAERQPLKDGEQSAERWPFQGRGAKRRALAFKGSRAKSRALAFQGRVAKRRALAFKRRRAKSRALAFQGRRAKRKALTLKLGPLQEGEAKRGALARRSALFSPRRCPTARRDILRSDFGHACGSIPTDCAHGRGYWSISFSPTILKVNQSVA